MRGAAARPRPGRRRAAAPPSGRPRPGGRLGVAAPVLCGSHAAAGRGERGMNVADAGRLVHVENIKQLKARYFRFVDSKQWDALRDVFTDDLLFYFESPPPA